jgi:hypothetical protein
MSAGKPNWQKLHEMGKLPKEQRGKVPLLAQLDAAEEKIKKLEAKIVELRAGGDSDEGPKEPESKPKLPEEPQEPSGDNPVQVRCDVEGCNFVASGRTEAMARNNLRLHMRSHENKEEDKKEE